MNKLLNKPLSVQDHDAKGKYEKFNLIENPFPSNPIVNKDSTDKRINGAIYENQIREKEYKLILNNFLKQPQKDLNHLRLGYIIDTSYIGRGNGKSAFLVNLQQEINSDFCLQLSEQANKCFAIYLTPEPGGRTKTFSSFVELFFNAILNSKIIEYCLATLRLEVIVKEYPSFDLTKYSKDDEQLILNLNTEDWFAAHGFDLCKISDDIFKNDYLQELPPTFPLFIGRNMFLRKFVKQDDFEKYFYSELKKGKERFDFIFSHMVRFFQSANFNGAYVLVDDFERIPDFQSARQKKDFALELRSCLFDGMYTNAKIGFFNIMLVLHAGVPRLISDAWAESGMENRSPISPSTTSKHIIPFEKLTPSHASLLLETYLLEYRITKLKDSDISPFSEDAIRNIGELSEYNAAKILKMAYDLLERAAEIADVRNIDAEFVMKNKGIINEAADKSIPTIQTAASTNLSDKIRE
jgi:hypothetical protein